MSDGTVPVRTDTAAIFGTPDEEQITLGFVQYFMWTAWVVVDGKAFKYSSHLDRSEAYRVAASFNGVVTEAPLVASYVESLPSSIDCPRCNSFIRATENICDHCNWTREMTNGGQESNH